MIPIFLIGVTLTGLMLRQVLNQNYEAEVTAKALLAMETMNSVREYTSSRVRPELIERLKTEFLPETVPAYSAREVFEELRKQPDYQNFYYKEATLNPTNPRDQADEFETKLVQQFREQDNLNELRGFRSLPTGEIFYIAHPLKVSKPSCLECHGSVSQAPQSLIERYGKENGFNWKLNEIVGAQIVSVPASEIYQLTQQALKVTMGFVIAVLTTMIATMILINFSLQRYVVRPIKQMARAAEAISMGDLDVEFNKRYDDEVGHLTDAFARMKMSLVMAMKRLKNK
jgi:methyl-accepting chemotaxis protein